MENSDDFVNLRPLHNDVENCICNLKSLRVEASSCRCLLIPILKDTLPDDLNLLISRKFEGNILDFRQVTKIYL